ncbi:hypothetical protein [Oricola cellulosilytica]|uniref:Uncharacterized protein n=1 Tax=Oricola cellulosilytica TaxID=1429082 RepID=A0A4R0PDN6_9HYPH|nr:hypothetical protein [Oricola cellulosilytica]TCD14315.1 hypothetical protein E0D97_09570 [Oricola cellulosilytica]
MRFLGAVLVLIGLFAAFGDRFIGGEASDFEIGRYEVFREDTGYIPATVPLSEGDAPLKITVEVAAGLDGGGESTLTLVVNGPSGATIATAVVLLSPETAAVTENGSLMADAAEIGTLERGTHTFLVGEGDRDDLGISAVDLIVEGKAGGWVNEHRPTGFAIMAVGGILFLFGGRRKRSSDRGSRSRSKTARIGHRKKRKSPLTWGRGRRD